MKPRILLGMILLLASAAVAADELRDFTSDGCSLFPDGELAGNRTLWCDCCVAHDMAYWRGGTADERASADTALRECVKQRTGSDSLADLMFHGVRAGGAPVFPNWYRWGYGWNYGRGYAPLTADELEKADATLGRYLDAHPEPICPAFTRPAKPILAGAAAAAAGQPVADTGTTSSMGVLFYPGYGTSEVLVMRGRVQELKPLRPVSLDDGALKNLWASAGAMRNAEGKAVPVQIALNGANLRTETDREGYFTLTMSTPPGLAPGRHPLTAVEPQGGAGGSVLVVPAENQLGIISDVDDTVVVSEVLSKGALLSNTFLRNPLQREPVAGVADFYRRLVAANPNPELSPIFYLSASPRQLQGRIQAFLDHNGFPRGVLLTKIVHGGSDSDPWLDQIAYKLGHIEALLLQFPKVRFVLVGDDGEKDPEVFHSIKTRFPNRIEAIWIRRVHTDPNRERYPGQGDLGVGITGREAD